MGCLCFHEADVFRTQWLSSTKLNIQAMVIALIYMYLYFNNVLLQYMCNMPHGMYWSTITFVSCLCYHQSTNYLSLTVVGKHWNFWTTQVSLYM